MAQWESRKQDSRPEIPPRLESPDAPIPSETGSLISAGQNELSSSIEAEIHETESLEAILGDLPSSELTKDLNSTKLLNEHTPEWVKKGLVLGDDHNLAVSSSLLPDLDQCREDLKIRMMMDVRTYLDKHVLENSSSHSLPELTQEYVEKYWVNSNQSFDNVQDRPSGTYHQLWLGLHISSDQLKMVREWEKHLIRDRRTKQAGILGGIGVGAITILSGLVGLMARREKAKLKG